MTVEQLRRIEDNKHIDDVGETIYTFDDWKPRTSAEYKSNYLSMLAELYEIEDMKGEYKAIDFAKKEMQEWIEIIEKNQYDTDFIVSKIHACKDFLNGEDLFGENYA